MHVASTRDGLHTISKFRFQLTAFRQSLFSGLEVERKKCRYGPRIEAPKGGWVWGGGIPLSSRGSGGASWAPRAGSEAEPRPKTILVRSDGARTALVAMHATEMT